MTVVVKGGGREFKDKESLARSLMVLIETTKKRWMVDEWIKYYV